MALSSVLDKLALFSYETILLTLTLMLALPPFFPTISRACAKGIERLRSKLGIFKDYEKVAVMVRRVELEPHRGMGDKEKIHYVIEIYRTAFKSFYPRVFRYESVNRQEVKGWPSGAVNMALVRDDADAWHYLKGESVNGVIDKVLKAIEFYSSGRFKRLLIAR